MGGIIGHQCALGAWMMEWFAAQMENVQEMENVAATPAQLEAGAKIARGIIEDWHGALRRLAKRALCLCVDQSYDDMKDFLSAYAEAFAKKPGGLGLGSVGHSAFEIHVVMLTHWRVVAQLGSIHALHGWLVRLFGGHRVGELKRIEKICQRIGLHYRKPGRPKRSR